LILALSGPENYRRIAYRIIGDLSRDFNSKTTALMLQNYKTFFNYCNKDMMNENEQTIL
jgi:hypothetical protein